MRRQFYLTTAFFLAIWGAASLAAAETLRVFNDFAVPITVFFKPSSEANWSETSLPLAGSASYTVTGGTVDVMLRTAAGNEYHKHNWDVIGLARQSGGQPQATMTEFRWGRWVGIGSARTFQWSPVYPTHFNFAVQTAGDAILLSRTRLLPELADKWLKAPANAPGTPLTGPLGLPAPKLPSLPGRPQPGTILNDLVKPFLPGGGTETKPAEPKGT